MSTIPLFDEPSPFHRSKVVDTLRRLASENIWIGCSSWKYQGWLGQVYTRDRYLARGRFSQKLFNDSCLGEYAETFPIVCGDFSFYQFPSQAYWQRLFRSARPELQYAFKVPEDITVRVFPAHDRYGARAGLENPSFLDTSLFQSAFLTPLERYRNQIAVLILEFGAFSKEIYSHASQFVEELDRFLAAIPRTFRYSVEIRNPAFLGPEYFQCLRNHGVSHVFNAWARMPELHRQIALRDAFTTGFTVCRALLRHGRAYEQAVKKFSPYQTIQDPYPEVRQAMRTLIQRARSSRRAAYIFVNNRLEGNAPQTIEGVVEELA